MVSIAKKDESLLLTSTNLVPTRKAYTKQNSVITNKPLKPILAHQNNSNDDPQKEVSVSPNYLLHF